MIDTALVILKFASLLLSGVFGVFGLLVKFKDDNGKITKYGRRALALILASTCVAMVSTAVEIYRESIKKRTTFEAQALEALETARRTEKLLSEISRGLQPISEFSLSFWVTVPTDHLKMESYVSRFERELPGALSLLKSEGRFPGYSGGSSDEGRNPLSIAFDASASLAPDPSKEKLAFTVLGYSDIELQFFKKPIDPKSHYAISDDYSNMPDLTMEVSAGLNRPGMGGDLSVEYSLKDKRFRLRGHDIASESKYWNSTGAIVSLPDLVGSQLFVQLRSIIHSGDVAEVDQYLPEIRRRFLVDNLVLNFGKGREFWLNASQFQRYQTRDGFSLYVFSFPESLEELNRLSR